MSAKTKDRLWDVGLVLIGLTLGTAAGELRHYFNAREAEYDRKLHLLGQVVDAHRRHRMSYLNLKLRSVDNAGRIARAPQDSSTVSRLMASNDSSFVWASTEPARVQGELRGLYTLVRHIFDDRPADGLIEELQRLRGVSDNDVVSNNPTLIAELRSCMQARAEHVCMFEVREGFLYANTDSAYFDRMVQLEDRLATLLED